MKKIIIERLSKNAGIVLCCLLSLASLSSNAQFSTASQTTGSINYYRQLSYIDSGDIGPDRAVNYNLNRSSFSVADANVTVASFSKGEGPRFLIVHNNENTGLAAAFDFISEKGGSILRLEYGNTRYISFADKLSKCHIDPNHIFTANGINTDVDRFCNGLISFESLASLNSLAQTVLTEYNADSLGYIVTLHNNTDGNFNIRSYVNDPFYKKAAEEVHINKQMDPDDLVFVTSPCFFKYLKTENINVVLQSETAPDDGSLSVYAMKSAIPYANVEVQFGHKDEQLRLIKAVDQMLQVCNVYPPIEEMQTVRKPVSEHP